MLKGWVSFPYKKDIVDIKPLTPLQKSVIDVYPNEKQVLLDALRVMRNQSSVGLTQG